MILFKCIKIILLMCFNSVNSTVDKIGGIHLFKDLSDFPNHLKSIYSNIDDHGFNKLDFDNLFTKFYEDLKKVTFGKLLIEDFKCLNEVRKDFIYNLSKSYFQRLIKKLVISINHIAQLAEDEEDYQMISDAIYCIEKDLSNLSNQTQFLNNDFINKFIISYSCQISDVKSVSMHDLLINDFNKIYSDILKLHFANYYSLIFFQKSDIDFIKASYMRLNSLLSYEFFDDVVIKRDYCAYKIKKFFIEYVKVRDALILNGFNIFQYFAKVDIYHNNICNVCFYDCIFFQNHEEVFDQALNKECFYRLKIMFALFLENHTKLYNYNLCLQLATT